MDRSDKKLVKIMYSTEVGKLSEEMSRLVCSRVEEFETELKSFKETWGNLPFDNSVKLRDHLDIFRRELALLDTKLDDIQGIFEASIEMSLPQRPKEEPRPSEEEDD